MTSLFIKKRDYDYRLALIKKRARAAQTILQGSKVFYCEGCRAPVIDSAPGRDAHARRKPECKDAMQYKPATK